MPSTTLLGLVVAERNRVMVALCATSFAGI
jgi:hypothetical protein